MTQSEQCAIGIDLGTSNSCVAVVRNGAAEVLADPDGHRIQASIVAFPAQDELYVGNAATPFLLSHPDRTVRAAKRLIGRFHFAEEVERAQAAMPYRIVEGPNRTVRIAIGDTHYSPEEIAALVLKRMKQIAEHSLGCAVSKAVVTVPAYFNDNQRQATRDAAQLAGLEVLRIINEPTAAAISCGFGRERRERIAVYDLGGGTFDISILEIDKDTYEVLATAGDTYLGGDDIDARIVATLERQLKEQHNLDASADPHQLAVLRHTAEDAKIRLSHEESVAIDITALPNTKPALALHTALTRRELSQISSDLLQRTFSVCDAALRGAGLQARELDGVILVGGPTRLPFVREGVHQYFGIVPSTDGNPDEIVACGAALQAHGLVQDAKPALLLDVTPLPLRISTVGGYTEEIIARNTPIPIERGRVFTTVRDNQQRVRVRVVQGDSRQESECEWLAEFEFGDLPSRPRGTTQVKVAFEIDANGIVHVSATDLGSGQQTSTTIHLSRGLSGADKAAAMQRTAKARV